MMSPELCLELDHLICVEMDSAYYESQDLMCTRNPDEERLAELERIISDLSAAREEASKDVTRAAYLLAFRVWVSVTESCDASAIAEYERRAQAGDYSLDDTDPVMDAAIRVYDLDAQMENVFGPDWPAKVSLSKF